MDTLRHLIKKSLSVPDILILERFDFFNIIFYSDLK